MYILGKFPYLPETFLKIKKNMYIQIDHEFIAAHQKNPFKICRFIKVISYKQVKKNNKVKTKILNRIKKSK